MKRFPSRTWNRIPLFLLALALAAGGTSERVSAQQVSGAIGIHDPSSVIKDGSMYFLYGTGNGIYNKWSNDGINWNDESTGVFLTPPAWTTQAVPSFTGTFWAPDISYFNGKYYLYYSVSSWGSIDSAIGVATSTTLNRNSPNYGWTDLGKVVQSDAAGQAGPNTDTTTYNAIDPSILTASDGRVWMSFGSYSSGILVTELNPSTGKRMNTSTLSATQVANNASGGGWGSTIEGSALVQEGGYYYLFVNYGGCCSGVDSTYDIRVGRSTSPNGPFVDKNGLDMRSGGGSMFLDDNGKYIGPGHFARFTDTDGTDYYGYHYYNGDTNGVATYDKERLYWTADGWPSAAAVNPDWKGTLSEGWGQTGNWWDAVVPDSTGAVANFGARSATRSFVTLEANRTVGKINFHSGGPNFTIRNTGSTLTLDADTGESATINVNAGTQTIDAPITAVDHLGVNVYSNTRLNLGNVSGTGLTKYGHGTLALNGTSTFSGATLVKWGTLEVNGSVTTNQYTSIGPILAENAAMTLKGTGSYTANADFNVGDTGNSTETATGTLTIQDQATLTVSSGGFFVGSGFSANTRALGTVNQTGGTVTVTNAADGYFTLGGRTSSLTEGTYNLSGGIVNANTSVRVGGRGTGTLNLSGSGELNTNKTLYLGFYSSGQGTINLDGGVLAAPSVIKGSGPGTLSFNGGILRANATARTFLQGLTAANVKIGGAIVDTQSYAATISQPLLHDSALGSTPDGGFLKQGTGTLTLTGVNTFTGDINIDGGTLKLSGAGSIANSANINVNSGASLDVSALSSTFALAGSQTLNTKSNTTVLGNVVAGSGTKITGNGTFQNNVTAQSGSRLQIGGSTTAPTQSLSVTNGDFETGIIPPGDADVDLWFDVNTYAGASDYWNTAQHEQGLSPTPDTGVLLGDGNGTTGGPNGAGGRWIYQQIGTKVATGSYSLSFDYGGDNNANTSNRAVAIRAEVFQGVFAGAADDNDISDEGLTLITTVNSPTTSLWGEGNYATFQTPLNLASANTADPLWLRLSNLPGAGVDPGSWVVIDNVVIQGTVISAPFDQTLTVAGSVSLAAGAVASFDIGTSGTSDLLAITGNLGVASGFVLEVQLDSSVPAASLSAGDSWNLFDFATSSGTFNELDFILPTGLSSGLEWDTSNLLTTGVLSVVQSGDFDGDGDVDGQDFLAWQRMDGTPGGLAAWQTHYGTTPAPLTAGATSVPEPSGLALLGLSSLLFASALRQQAFGGRLYQELATAERKYTPQESNL